MSFTASRSSITPRKLATLHSANRSSKDISLNRNRNLAGLKKELACSCAKDAFGFKAPEPSNVVDLIFTIND